MIKSIILLLIKIYQKIFSLDQGFLGKLIPGYKVCIFNPTCSEYMYQSIKKYGIVKGLWLGLKRLIRCGPWSSGGYDPVP